MSEPSANQDFDPVLRSHHPIYPRLHHWMREQVEDVSMHYDLSELRQSGDMLFLLACQQIVPDEVCQLFDNVLLVHAGDLPEGGGWSPLVHAILAGKNRICLSLLEAAERVDSKAIWRKEWITFDGTETHPEIDHAASRATLRLMSRTIVDRNEVESQVREPTYCERRRPDDGKVSAEQSLEEIFDLLRAADPNRYPVFFEHRGRTSTLSLQARV